VQHYRVITFKVSICGIVIHSHETKIPIDRNADEEEEQIFDISKELVAAILASCACLTLLVFTHQQWQEHNSLNTSTADEYISKPLRNDTLEKGQKKQDWISTAFPYSEIISQDSISGNMMTQIGTVKHINRPYFHDLNLYIEDIDVRKKVDIASSGEDQ